MARPRNILNVRSILEHIVRVNELVPVLQKIEGNSIPPILVEALQEASFYARAALRKAESTRKDLRIGAEIAETPELKGKVKC